MTESCGEKSPDTKASRGLTSVGTVEEADATDRVKIIYGDIKTTLGIDFVPNMYRATAKEPYEPASQRFSRPLEGRWKVDMRALVRNTVRRGRNYRAKAWVRR